MRFSIVALFALAVACQGAEKAPGKVANSLINPTSCAPDDGFDDRPCIQAAIDAACATGGGTVSLWAGKWMLSKPPGRDNASLWIRCSGVSLEGDGSSTVLMMTGSGNGMDWSGVRFAGEVSRGSASNLTISSDDAFNVNEQTHLLMLGSTVQAPGSISNIQLHHLWLRHPVRPEVAGDCLRMVGELATPIRHVDVGSVVFEACDRSGIAFQRASQDVNVYNARFITIGKTAIDMEPSGAGAIERITMTGLDIRDSGISIAGQSGVRTSGVVLANSHVGGRVGVTYASDVSLIGVHISEVANGSEGSLMVRASESISVTGGSIRREMGSVPGPAVRVTGTNGNFPGALIFNGVRIRSDITGPVIDMQSVQDSTITGCNVSGPDVTSIYARATGRDVARLMITGNHLTGAIKLVGGPYAVIGSLVSGNIQP